MRQPVALRLDAVDREPARGPKAPNPAGGCRRAAATFFAATISALVAAMIATPAAAKLPQAIKGFAPSSPISYRSNATFILTATGGGSGKPVTFASDTRSICTVAGNVATVLRTGTCKLKANQAGNSKYSAAPTVRATVIINRGDQTITFDAPSSVTVGDAPVALSASSSSGLPVSFVSSTATVCTVSGIMMTPLAPGSCAIVASQAGNANYNPAPAVSRSLAVVDATPPTAIVSIAVGYAHACALTDRASVLCWGSNQSGQLGDGSASDRYTPVDVDRLGAGVHAIEAGRDHSCAILDSGAVRCWGDNARGQLGDGTLLSRSTPVDVTGLPNAVVALSAGAAHSCAVVSGGSIKCWGDNPSGQLGDGTTTARPTPSDVTGLAAASADVRTGDAHSCATLADDTVQCWGSNTAGQLGDGTSLARANPTNVVGLDDAVVRVEAAARHSCALTGGGGVRCWGGNDAGQIGDGTTITRPLPVTPSGAAGGVSAIAAAQATSCALSASGSVRCWGEINHSSIPADVEGLSDAVMELGVGANFACVLTHRGAVKCWGSNDRGQLGDGTVTARSTPADVVGLAGNSLANQVIAFAVIADQELGAAPFTVGAAASSGLPVSFRSITPAVCTVANATVTLAAAGPCTIIAAQSGNANTNPAPAVTQTFTVTPPRIAQAITGFAPATPIAFSTGATIALGANGGGSGNPVIFGSLTQDVCTVSGAIATVVRAGVCRLVANQAGNAAYRDATQVEAVIVIEKATQDIAFDPLADRPLESGSFELSARASSGLPVSFASGTTSVCVVAGTTASLLEAGTCTIRAMQAGDENFLPAADVARSFVVTNASSQPETLPHLVTPGLPHAVLGQPYAGSLIVSGSSPVTSMSVGGLPPGITATHDGQGTLRFDGTPALAGEFSVALDATNAVGTASLSITLSVDPFVNRIDALASGSRHSCVVFDSGVRCWGDNSFGQLGNGRTLSSRAAVVAVPAGSGATAVSAGAEHSCAIIDNGVSCWGRNSSGQLGDGTTASSPIPVTVLAAGSGATAVAAGAGHSCAIVNGGVRCWGSNTFGQLGDGSTASSLRPVISIADGAGVTAIAVGATHSCAVIAGGIQCWGKGSDNLLGNELSANSPIPVVALPPGSGATAIAASATSATGDSHTCAVVTDGVRCWGSNYWGKLGGSSTGSEARYALVPGSGVTAVALGANHSCAVARAGVTCWGSNSAGQLGDGTRQTLPYQGALTVAIAEGSNVTALAAGREHTCVVVNGGVQCWGANASGQLGNDDPFMFPVAVMALATDQRASAVTANADRTCAVAAGRFKCWGRDFYSTSFYTTPIERTAAELVVTQGALGTRHFCTVASDGVRCAISNDRGQFGNGTTQAYPETLASLPLGRPVRSIAAGADFGCAVVDGAVHCWGANDTGQLGIGSLTDALVPQIAISGDQSASLVSSRESHACAVADGGVQCWGANTYGQLGNGSTTRSLVPTPAIGAGSHATATSAGMEHSCAVVDGGVRCWGNNASGQLGDASTTSRLLPVTTIAAGSGVTAVAAGATHSCAIVRGGVQCWGDNSAGQLGDGSYQRSLVPLPAIPEGSNVTSISVGATHSCAALSGGVVCWGSNRVGQLANPATDSPRKVFAAITSLFPPSPPAITGVAAGTSTITLAISPPASNGGATITGYTATCVASSQPTSRASAVASASSITVTGVTAGTTYLCSVTATTIAGTSDPSGSVAATPGSPGQETVSIVSPASYAELVSPQSLTVMVAAQSGAGTISKIELFDGFALLTNYVPPEAVATYTLSFDWKPVPAGNHTLTARVTNSQGATKTSDPVYVQVQQPPSVTVSSNAGPFAEPATIELVAAAQAAGLARVAFVELFNGSTLLAKLTTAPYRFDWTGVAAGNYIISARVTDTFGLQTSSAPLDVTVGAGVNIALAPGLDGSNSDDDALSVSGTLQAPANSSVTVNGQLASVTPDGRFFVNAVPLAAGTNTVTAIVTTVDGETSSHSVGVLRSAVPAAFEVAVDPAQGIAAPDSPFVANISISSATGTEFETITIACNESADGVEVSELGTYGCVYPLPGLQLIVVTIRDSAGNVIHVARRQAYAWLPADRFAFLTGVYRSMTDRLKAGNIDGAVRLFTTTNREAYRTAFVEAGTGLGAMVDGFGTLRGLRTGADYAEIWLTRQTGEGEMAFSVGLIQDSDGIWRIDEF